MFLYDSTFFKTKYCIPRANPSTVSRKRLQEKLNRAPERTLTLVVAPMGYGKTTAVYKWAEQSGLPTAWLSLDTGDNDTIVFWKYFFAAAEQILPGIADKAAYTFSSRQLLEANVHINMLVDELARHGGKATLVIDDLHTVTNGQILKGLSHLLRYLPVSVHMIVISRTEPAIELEKLELQSQVLRITAQDLRFRQDEIADFYLKRDCAFGTEMIEKIGGYTEGWVAAMVAVAVSSQNDCVSHDLPDGVTVTDPAIYQYLMNEVFESYPPEKQAFLLKISILELLREDICRAVTGEDNAARFFEDMRKRNEFLTVLGDESGAYRLHPILKDFLLRKLKQDFDMFAGLHRKAAMWYRDKDLLPPAVSHYLSGMWYGEALELIEMQLGGFASKNEYETACSWLEQLPEQYKNKSAKIAVFYSMYHAQNRDFDAALRWVGYAKELVKEDQTGEIGIRDRILVAISPINLLFREGNAEELCKLIQNNEIHKSMTVKAIEYVDLNGTDIYVYRSPVHIMIKMFEISSEAVGKLRESYNLLCAKNPGFIPLAVGECYYERNRPEDALPPLLDAMESAKLLSYPGVMVPAMANLSRIKRCKGDMAGALLVLEECENRLKAIQKPHWNDMVTALKIRWYLETGDTDRALEWLGINKLQIFSEINRVREFELLVLARVLWADKKKYVSLIFS